MTIKTWPRVDLEHKGIRFYFVASNITGGVDTKIDNKNYPFFVYDETYMDCLRKNPSCILEIFEWMETDGYKLVDDCFTWVDMMSPHKKLKDYFDYMKYYYRDNPDKYVEEINFLKGLLNNIYVHETDKKSILEYLEDPKNIIVPRVKKPEKKIVPGYIYLIESLGYYKIGKTTKLTNRMKNFSTIFPAKITEIHVFKTEDINNAELVLHKKFEHLRHVGEWFNLSQEEVDYICSIEDYGL